LTKNKKNKKKSERYEKRIKKTEMKYYMGGIERSLKYGFIRNAEIRFHTFSLYLYHLLSLPPLSLSLSLSLSRFSLSLITSRSHFLAPYRFSTSQETDRKFSEPPPFREHITRRLCFSLSLTLSYMASLFDLNPRL